MRLITLIKKSLIENLRDWKVLALTLLFAPIFVVLMYFLVASSPSTYSIVFVNHDLGGITADGSTTNSGNKLIDNITGTRYPDGTPIISAKIENDTAVADKMLIDRSADYAVEIPANFTSALLAYRDGKSQLPAAITTSGDPANARYIMAAVYSDMTTYTFVANATGAPDPLLINFQTIGQPTSGSNGQTTFDMLIPGLMGLSLSMLMFTTAASFIREKDKGTILRLNLSSMRAREFVGSIAFVQVLIGLSAMLITFLCAVALGFHIVGQVPGSVIALLIVGVLGCLSIIAISLIMATFLRSVFDLLTIGCIPFFILMFFSGGGMFPLPEVPLFGLAGRTINVNDILPTTHVNSAMNKILNHSMGLGDLRFELGAIIILTAAYFAIGIWLFRRKYLRLG